MYLSWDALSVAFLDQRDFSNGYSPLYEALFGYAAPIATKRAAGQPLAPNEKAFVDLLESEWADRKLFTGTYAALLWAAAIHATVLAGDVEAKAVARFYETAGGKYNPAQDRAALYQALDGLFKNPSVILRNFLRERNLQTNEVSRGVLWLIPAILLTCRTANLPITLVDLGCSAGLNLVSDTQPWRWKVIDGPDRTLNVSDGSTPLMTMWLDFGVESEAERTMQPGEQPKLNVAKRIGYDLNPPNTSDPADVLALRACVWGDQKVRLERLDRALETFQSAVPTPQIHANNILDVTRNLHEQIAPETKLLVVYNSSVTMYMTDEDFTTLKNNIAESFKQLPEGVRALWMELEPARHDDPDPFRKLFPVKAHLIRSGESDLRMEYVAHTEPHPQTYIFLPVWDTLID